ncbi:MAG: alpha/beta hydrolase [Bacteroidota bacterium]
MQKLLFLLITISTLSGCFDLDDNLYNPSKISEYKLDDYNGDNDFHLDLSYRIPDSLVHIFTLSSQAGDESSSTKIYAIYIGSMSHIATDTVIMYCHGNKDHMDGYWTRGELLANTGSKNRFGIMMVDYRGYGMSEGQSSENGLYADVDAALKWLKSKGLTDSRLVIYGFSLGSAPATKLAAENYSMKPSKLMLEAPFASAETMIQDGSGLDLPGDFFTSLSVNNGEEIKSVSQPFFWIHGEADDFLNIETHGQVVFDNYSGSYGEAHRIPGANHRTIQTTMGFQAYMNAVEDFITLH